MAASLSSPRRLRHAGEAAVVQRAAPGDRLPEAVDGIVVARAGGRVAQADELVQRAVPWPGWSKPSSLQPAHGSRVLDGETMALALACSVALSTSADTAVAGSRESGWWGCSPALFAGRRHPFLAVLPRTVFSAMAATAPVTLGCASIETSRDQPSSRCYRLPHMALLRPLLRGAAPPEPLMHSTQLRLQCLLEVTYGGVYSLLAAGARR